MLRDKSLVPLSRQHQHALALCVRIDRGTKDSPVDLQAWQSEITSLFQQEISAHFEIEERDVFPVARKFSELRELVEQLQREHEQLRALFRKSVEKKMDVADLQSLGAALSAHIRKEEGQLFEQMQALMAAEDLAEIGKALWAEIGDNGACIVPSEATRLRPKK
jgi:hemerythrin-like domain-containing protein